ncbi:MAG: hypothetical protein QOE08_2151 [Thermoleophilaceae bacterium]|nr:hypothetical protein [Thermoleophilaceae bacterium]
MDDLTTTQGIVALAAGGVAIVTLLFAIVLAVKLRGMRRAQRAVMGEAGQRDLVSHSARLEQGFTDLRDWLEESMESLERRMEGVETRVDGCVAHRALVRYDAYNELSGHQSSSIALLDAHRSGVIITSIVHRDQARLYVKQLQEGESEIPLSPEEQQAVDSALAAPVTS